ncbi:MAG: Fe-S cluster assembly protein SufD [Alphaproteobacteria bacterium]
MDDQTMSENSIAPGAEGFVDQFAAIRGRLPGEGGAVAALREAGLARFAAVGWPHNKIEAWKYTTLRPLARIGFSAAAGDPGTAVQDAPRSLFPETAARVVVVNGRVRPDLSRMDGLPRGASLRRLADVLRDEPERVAGLLAASAEGDDQPMAALNLALMTDGIVLSLEAGVAVDAPIELLHLVVPGETPPAVHVRSVVTLAEGARATLVERHLGLDGGAYLANGATDVTVAEGAALLHVKVQTESPEAYHLHANRVDIARDARYHSVVLSKGARLSRNQIEAVVGGSGAECLLDGVYAGSDRQLLDHSSLIDHTAPHARSRQVYHGVLGDQSRGVFQGKIIVRRPAQKTDGHQLNRALLLSDGAEIDAKPALEIYADDVKCSHGSTAGDIDADALFYLRARGIPEAAARGLLVGAFLDEVLEHLPEGPVRTALSAEVQAWHTGGTA